MWCEGSSVIDPVPARITTLAPACAESDRQNVANHVKGSACDANVSATHCVALLARSGVRATKLLFVSCACNLLSH